MRIGLTVLLAPFRPRTAHVVQLGPVAVAQAPCPFAAHRCGGDHAGGHQDDVGGRAGQQSNGVAHDDDPISLVVQYWLVDYALGSGLAARACSTAMARRLVPRLLISSAISLAT